MKTHSKEPKESQNDKLQQIGQRLREFREEFRDEKHTQAGFAKWLNITPGYLSQVEAGKKTPSLDLLLQVSQKSGKDLAAILTGRPEQKALGNFDEAIALLQQSKELGIVGVYSNRAEALFRLYQFARLCSGFEVHITGSSLKGLREDPTSPFVALLKDKRDQSTAEHKIQVIFTHLKYAFAREDLEERSTGSIVSEVSEGVVWAVRKWKLRPEDVKFLRTPPTTFSIYVQDSVLGSMGLINSYPVTTQAYKSPCLVIQMTREQASTIGRTAQSTFFQGMHAGNFTEPWNNAHLTVGLNQGIQECIDQNGDETPLAATKANILKTIASKLKETLEEDNLPHVQKHQNQ